MTINLTVPNPAELKPRITVFGVGGAGGNAVNNMIESNLEGVEFVVANTDAQAITQSLAERRIQMGSALTQGLGAGSQPQIGAGAAEEALPEITDQLAGAHMTFITAGMGGGTGTGAAPVIARAAKELGILTVGVVTKPFHFEGQRRQLTAERGIEQLAQHVDTLIVIPNQNLFRVANEKTTFAAAFAMADQVLYSGVASITELMTKEGLINLDFADVRSIMSEMGKAMMGTGEASGEKRAIEAAEAAISNPLLDDVSMRGARGLLISIAGGPDLTLYEVDEAATRIREEVDPEANIILGATFDDTLEGTMRVSVVATGLNEELEMDGEDRDFQQDGDEKPQAAYTYRPAAAQPQTTEAPIAAPTMGNAPSATYEPEIPEQLPEQGHEHTAHNQRDHATYQPAVMAPRVPEPQTRMPEPEDFPEPAQRQLAARHSEIGEIAEHGQRKQKKSLLERLANVGLGRRDDDSAAHNSGTEPAMNRSQQTQAPQTQAPQQIQADNVHPLNARVETENESDELEIPAFLRRQAN